MNVRESVVNMRIAWLSRGNLRAKHFAVLCFGLVGSVALAGPINPIGQASTSTFQVATSPQGQTPRGWDFLVNSTGVTVTQLGVNAATSIPIELTLWDDATQTELAQVLVTSAANSWAFANLASGVALTAGKTYSVIGWADTTTSANPWVLFNGSPPASFNPTGTIQYLDTRFANGIGKDTFPTFRIASPAQYGVTDIGYTLDGPGPTPEPASFALVGLGAAVLCLVRSRTRSKRQGAA
jgi:hypothetical protein